MKLSVWVVRLMFIGLSVLVAANSGKVWFNVPDVQQSVYTLIAALIGLAVSGAVVVIDIVFQKKSVAAIVAICLGLIVGTLLEIMVKYVVELAGFESLVVPWLEIAVLLFLCYIAITIILQTREDFRLVIPYVKFAQEGAQVVPFVLDTSVVIDGRIADIAETGVLDNVLVVPRFVLNELQGIADSSDRLKRNRGRRGLDVLKKLQECSRTRVEIRDMFTETDEPVDTKLISFAKAANGRIVTNDFNLNKIAQLQDVGVININDLAQALKPVVLPGEEFEVKIIRPGEEMGQGIGYLDDGTMVVVEQGRELIGQKIPIVVSNIYQTSAGRMIFGKAAAPKGQTPSNR